MLITMIPNKYSLNNIKIYTEQNTTTYYFFISIRVPDLIDNVLYLYLSREAGVR